MDLSGRVQDIDKFGPAVIIGFRVKNPGHEDRQRILRFSASDDLLLFGIRTEGIRDPFQIGGFVVHPTYDLRRYLRGYDSEKVAWILQSEAKYAQFVSAPSDQRSPTDLFITSLRLLKPGWIASAPIYPVARGPGIVVSKELDYPPGEQLWSDPIIYKIKKRNISTLRRIHQSLCALPAGYLDVALRRFNRSYDYWTHPELDDCYVDLWIALESMASCERRGIEPSVKRRVTKLLSRTSTQESRLQLDIGEFWSHRCDIVHGQETTEEDRQSRWASVEGLRILVRKTILTSITLLAAGREGTDPLPKPMARVIDAYLLHL